jgi:hypothetical protein
MMNTFIADTSLQQSLSNLPGLTAVRDSKGTLLGYFSPASQTAEAYVQAAAQLDPEEMKRRKLENEAGRRTSEVLERIARSDK